MRKQVIIALKTGSRPMYEVAHAAGVHPSLLSKWINGIEPIHEEDPRIVKLGRILGIPRHLLLAR